MTKKEETGKLEVEALREAASGDSRASPLYRWMWGNHENLSEILDIPRPNWKGVVEYLTAQGFTAQGGGPLKPDAVSKMWERVCRRRDAVLRDAEARKRRKARPLAMAPDPMVREVVRKSASASASTANDVAMPDAKPVGDALADLMADLNNRSGRKN